MVLVTESTKAVLCLVSLAWPRRGAPPQTLHQKSTARNLASVAGPAACYLVQNLALQRASADLDSVTFNCLNQTKVVATAVTLYLVTGQKQSLAQVVALALVTLAGLMLQVTGERARMGSSGSVEAFRRGVAVRLASCSVPRVSLRFLTATDG